MSTTTMSRSERRQAKQMARISALNPVAFGTAAATELPLAAMGPEVDHFFADDSRQPKPSRPGMGPLVAIGGVNVGSESVNTINQALDLLCQEVGFPDHQEFKWSPGRELWMRKNLIRGDRTQFFISVLEILRRNEAMVNVVISDTTAKTATKADTPEMDVVNLYLERVEGQCQDGGSQGFVVLDRPSGGRCDEDAFLSACWETIRSGTDYVKPDHIAEVIPTSSKYCRLLQAADLVTSCTLAMVAGESKYAPPVFEHILPLFYRGQVTGQVGGWGLKIHPDFKYANLYHWLVKDTFFRRGCIGYPLPLANRPYASDAFTVWRDVSGYSVAS